METKKQMVFEQMVMKLKEVVQLAVEQVEERWNVMGQEVIVGAGFRHVQNQNESTYQYSIQRTLSLIHI